MRSECTFHGLNLDILYFVLDENASYRTAFQLKVTMTSESECLNGSPVGWVVVDGNYPLHCQANDLHVPLSWTPS